MDSTIKELNECFICWMEFKWIPPDPVTLTIHISEAKLYSIQMNPDLGCSIFWSPLQYQFFFRLFELKSCHKLTKPNFVFSVKNSQRFNDWAVTVPVWRDEDQDHVHRQQCTGRRREKQVNNNNLFFSRTSIIEQSGKSLIEYSGDLNFGLVHYSNANKTGLQPVSRTCVTGSGIFVKRWLAKA